MTALAGYVAQGGFLRHVAGVRPRRLLRFHALRLHEAGMIKSSPQMILAQGTDSRFLNELRKELKP